MALYIRSLWAVLAGRQQMSCSHAATTTRSSSGTSWRARLLWFSNCRTTYTPLTCTGSPKPSVARNRPKPRSLSLPAVMASLFFSLNREVEWVMSSLVEFYCVNCWFFGQPCIHAVKYTEFMQSRRKLTWFLQNLLINSITKFPLLSVLIMIFFSSG